MTTYASIPEMTKLGENEGCRDRRTVTKSALRIVEEDGVNLSLQATQHAHVLGRGAISRVLPAQPGCLAKSSFSTKTSTVENARCTGSSKQSTVLTQKIKPFVR